VCLTNFVGPTRYLSICRTSEYTVVIDEGARVSAGRQGGFDVVLARAWSRFEGNLASYVASMPAGSYVTITSAQATPGQRGQRPYVDLVAVDVDQLIGVASLPSYLYPSSPDIESADRRLHGLGWSEPGKPTADGTVMDFALDGVRDEAALFATTAVATFREVWNVPHPSFLNAWAVDMGSDSSGPAALSYDDEPRTDSRDIAALPVPLRSLHAFCEVLGARVDSTTVRAVCGEADLHELYESAHEHARSCFARAERSADQAASRVWRRQGRSWTDTANSLHRASVTPRLSSAQDRPAKSTGS